MFISISINGDNCSDYLIELIDTELPANYASKKGRAGWDNPESGFRMKKNEAL